MPVKRLLDTVLSLIVLNAEDERVMPSNWPPPPIVLSFTVLLLEPESAIPARKLLLVMTLSLIVWKADVVRRRPPILWSTVYRLKNLGKLTQTPRMLPSASAWPFP